MLAALKMALGWMQPVMGGLNIGPDTSAYRKVLQPIKNAIAHAEGKEHVS